MRGFGALAAGLGVGLGLALATAAPADAAEPCTWEGGMPATSTAEGHRVTVIFDSFTGQKVRLQVDEQPFLERTLTTAEWSTAYSASLQCRVEGRRRFTLTVDGRTTSLYLDIDGPLQIYISPAGEGLDISLFETDMDTLLLD